MAKSTITDCDEDGTCISNAVLSDDIQVNSETATLPVHPSCMFLYFAIECFSETAELICDVDWYVRASVPDLIVLYNEMSKTYSATPLCAPEDGTKFLWYSLHKIHPHGVNYTVLEDLLRHYDLPHYSQVELALPPSDTSKCWMPHKSLLVLETPPVTRDQVTGGGVLTVSFEVEKYYHHLSAELVFLVTEHHKARFNGDKSREQELLNQINATKDYRIVEIDERVLLTRKYRIRLSGNKGIDGIEAELLKIVNGKCLKIDVYHIDDKGCCIGDVYCDGILVQDKLLEKGFEMLPDPELAEWEKDAPGMEQKEDVMGMEYEQLV